MIKRPLKAPTKPIDISILEGRWPFLVSDKEDGIRCLIDPDRGAVSQKMLPIRNDHIRNFLRPEFWAYLDGELVTFTNGVQDDFHTVQSKVMSKDGYPDFCFLVFDYFRNIYDQYTVRCHDASNIVNKHTCPQIRLLPQTLVSSTMGLEMRHDDAVRRGKEGLMIRHPKGWYKEGRSTFNEAYLLKMKTFIDDEAIVIGLVEEMENCNLATTDAHGLTKRSKHLAGMKGKGQVGALSCSWHGQIIQVSGIPTHLKQYWWTFPDRIVGETITFKHQPHGMKDLPRCPSFRGIRKD